VTNLSHLRAAAAAAAILALGAFAHRPLAADAPPVVHEVKMTLNGATARFDPATVTVRAGDRVRFVVVSGAPHNVSFDPEKLPADVRRTLRPGRRRRGLHEGSSRFSAPRRVGGSTARVRRPCVTYRTTTVPFIAMPTCGMQKNS
jgi:plastocyanin